MENDEIYWHGAFPAAIQLELRDYKNVLVYDKEYQLNSEPIKVDLLVIKKEPGVVIKNEIGSFFKRHNLLEYKGPGDRLNMDVFFKGIGYAALYKQGGNAADERKTEDITLTFVRAAHPRKLFQELKDKKIEITKTGDGIYRIASGILFDIQIVVTNELDEQEHIWIASLTRKITEKTAQTLVNTCGLIYDKDEKESAHTVLDVVTRGNRAVFGKLKEEATNLFEALMEIMQPELDVIINDRVEKKAYEIAEEKANKIAEEKANIIAEEKLKERDALIMAQEARIKELEKQISSME